MIRKSYIIVLLNHSNELQDQFPFQYDYIVGKSKAVGIFDQNSQILYIQTNMNGHTENSKYLLKLREYLKHNYPEIRILKHKIFHRDLAPPDFQKILTNLEDHFKYLSSTEGLYGSQLLELETCKEEEKCRDLGQARLKITYLGRKFEESVQREERAIAKSYLYQILNTLHQYPIKSQLDKWEAIAKKQLQKNE